MKSMVNHRIYTTPFSSIYPHYVAKIEQKGRTEPELHKVIQWLTGYDPVSLRLVIEKNIDFETFFSQAPAMNPSRHLITGTICGIRVENIEHPLMREIRYLDKVVDELAKGKTLDKIFRSKNN